MTILSEFHTEVSNEINKGTDYDAYIPRRTEWAVRNIERNYTYKYMERFTTFTQSASTECPRAIPFPNSALKSIKFLRYTKESEFTYLKQIDPHQLRDHSGSSPHGFWLDGVDYLWLDCDFTEDIAFEFSFIQFSIWQRDNDTYTNWLLDHAFDLLLGETMIYMAPIAREAEWVPMYKDLRDRAQRTLFIADSDLRESVTDDSMIYGG